MTGVPVSGKGILGLWLEWSLLMQREAVLCVGVLSSVGNGYVSQNLGRDWADAAPRCWAIRQVVRVLSRSARASRVELAGGVTGGLQTR